MSSLRHTRDFVVSCCSVTWLLARAGAASVATHWALALFSLLAAFGVWVAVQDVENPEIQGIAPASGGIAVRAVNVPDGYLVDDIQPVSVRVEAREEVLAELTPGDFEATVDMKGAALTEQPERRPVRVTSLRDDVRVLDILPTNTVEVRLIRAATRELPVTVRRTAPLPAQYEEAAPPVIDPPEVVISGRQDLVESVATVELEVNLSGERDGTVEKQGTLIARTASGNEVRVQIDPATARATFEIEQIFSTRTLALQPVVVGRPAPGFIVRNVVVDPSFVVVTGQKAIVDGLQPPINVERVDVNGARDDVTQTRQVQLPANVTSDRTSVVVRVAIEPIVCEGGNGATEGCQDAVFYVAPVVVDLPEGLRVAPGLLSVPVRVSGPLAQVSALRPGDIQVRVSVRDAAAGTAQYTPEVSAPQGIRAEADPITITLEPVP